MEKFLEEIFEDLLMVTPIIFLDESEDSAPKESPEKFHKKIPGRFS